MTENELTSQNALFTSSPEVASPHLRICGTQAVEERPREGFPLESGVARRAFKGTSAEDGKGGEIARPKYVAPPIFTFSQPVDVTFNQIAEKSESIFGTSRGAISTLLAPPVSPPPSAHPAFRTPPSPGATSVFGGGSTTTSFNHSSKSPLPSSPNTFGCLMQPPPLSLQSRWPPKAKSSQNLFFGQELGILRRKNDNLEKEAKKLRKEKNDLKEDATKWREAKKKLDAEEVSKKAELTRIKQELQLALSKVQIGAIHINNKLTFSSNRGRRQKLISGFFPGLRLLAKFLPKSVINFEAAQSLSKPLS